MKSPNLAGLIITMLCINILLLVSGVTVIDNQSSNSFMNSFIDIDTYDNNGTVVLTDGFKDTAPSNYEGSSDTGGVLAFGIDAIKAVKNFLIFVVNIVFTPLGLFLALPSIFGLIIGLPLVVMMVFGLVAFVRSGK